MARNKGKRPGGPSKPGPGTDKPAAGPADKPAAVQAEEPREAAKVERRTNGAGSETGRAVPPSASTPSGAAAQPTGEARTERAKPGEPGTPAAPLAAESPKSSASAPPSVPGRPGPPETGRGPLASGSPGAPPSGGPTGQPPSSGGPERPSRPSGAPSEARPPAAGARGFVAGLIGGLIGAAAAFFLLQGFGPSGEVEALRVRVEQLGEAVNSVEGRAAQLDELAGRVGALEGGEGLTDRVAALEASIEQRPANAGAAMAELRAQIGALAQRISGAEGAPAAGVPQEVADRLADLEGRIAELADSRSGAATGGGDLAEIRQQIADLQTEIDRVAAVGDLAGRTDANQERIAALGSQLEGLEAQLTGERERTEGLLGRIQGLSERLGGAESRLSSLSDVRERAAALALVSAQLDEAIRQAAPFDGTLQRLAALGGDAPAVHDAVTKLEPLAAGGVPSREELRREFEAVAEEILQRAQAPEGEGMIDQAVRNLKGLVSVRPVGADAEGPGVDARVARAEAKLAQDDLAGAVAEIEGLEGPAAEAAAGWLERARARLTAEQALASLQDQARDLLTRSP
jgi:hypothetical protein